MMLKSRRNRGRKCNGIHIQRTMFSIFLVMVLVLSSVPGISRTVSAAVSEWSFDFGGKGCASGFTEVKASTGYDSSRGYGFRNTSQVTDVAANGANELSDGVQFKSTDLSNTFDVDLPNGLYDITVYLGNTTRTSIRAEDCLQIINMTGDNAKASFQIPITDGQLNIMATEGKAGYPFTISSLIIKKVSDNPVLPPTVWICGDSTVCNYYPLDTSTQAGWGQVLDQYIDTNTWQIHNMAASGQYAKGFVDAGQFDTILKYGKKGDIYIISIGINDTNYSNADEYYETVSDMADKATEKGMKVVLVKQQGRSGDVSRTPRLTGRWFGDQLDKIGQEQNLQVVDLFNLALDYFISIGQEATDALYMDGDTLHPNREGAKVLANIISQEIDFTVDTDTPSHSSDTIYIAGDSTVQSYGESYKPQQGWGYYIQNYLKTDFQVENHAIAGRSSKSFFNDGRLQTILDKIKEGDYLLIQFGINDGDYSKEERYAPLCGKVQDADEGSYEWYIQKYVTGALEKGAVPVLISPTLGIKAYSNGSFSETYTGHSDSLKKISEYYDVPFINLNALMVTDYNNRGYDSAYQLHMCGAQEGSTDMTHFCEAGAENAAMLLAEPLNATIASIDAEKGSDSEEKNPVQPKEGQKQVESLDRGLVAIKTDKGVYLSWRLLGTESYETEFNIYRNGEKIAGPISDSTNYTDESGSASDVYKIRTVLYGIEKRESKEASVWSEQYLDVPIEKPADMDGATYSANDATVADVDGDGQYEIILKWDPSNSQDNSKSGITSNVYIDCYKLDGSKLWRIDLGKNIRAGAHYTQFIAYDLDGDGKAELAMKTADGTVAGDGQVIGDSSKDYRNDSGYILDGPEYLTLFEGATGKILDTIDYEPSRGKVSDWGDSYGNRVDRFLACTAYLDGQKPSLVMCRGYYTRAVLVAYDVKDGKLSKRWTFDSNTSGNGDYAGQGNHNLASADVDEDGKDEIVYGSAVIDDNGTGLYSTKQGHGDAQHVSDFDPEHPGMEIFQVHEGSQNAQMRDAKTGQQLWVAQGSSDVGRGIIANIGPDYYPYVVSCSLGNYDRNGTTLDLDLGKFGQNFLIWWDGDLYREGLDRTYINKYNYNTKGIDRLLTAGNVHSNNSTKATPTLSGDILGDWREEVIWPTADDTALRIYTTTTTTEKKLYTFVHDVQYREAIAWQNVAYNQPPHPSFYVGEDMPTPTQPDVYTVGNYQEKILDDSSEKPAAEIEEGVYMIKNAHSEKYLDLQDGNTENAANIQQWAATGPASYNTWNIVKASDGYYKIYSQAGDKKHLLDVNEWSKEDGTNIQSYTDNNGKNQLFKFFKNTDGTYAILTKVTQDNSAISVENDSTDNGANVCQMTYRNSPGQKWLLEPVEQKISVTGVILDQTNLTLEEKQTATLIATVEPEDASDQTLTWISDNEDIVTVDENGVITALKEGTATITVKTADGEKTAVCEVSVIPKIPDKVSVTDVTLTADKTDIYTGETTKVVAAVVPSDADNQTVTFQSSDDKIAKVDENGIVTGISEGEVIITVTTEDGGKTATCKIRVNTKTPDKVSVTDVTLTADKTDIYTGETTKVVAAVVPSDADNQTVTFQSSDDKIAKVDENGIVTGISEGEVIITVTTEDDGKTATCKIRVNTKTPDKVSVTDVTLTADKTDIYTGETTKVVAAVVPSDADNQTVTFQSSDDKIAKVDENGIVTGISEGEVIITVTTEDGGKTATCKITISEATKPEVIEVSSVILSDEVISIESGNSIKLIATVEPENATNKTVTWSSNDETVAIVSDSGKVLALEEGTAVITAKAGNQTAKCMVTVKSAPNEEPEPGKINVTGITIDSARLALTIGGTNILQATVLPENADNQNVIWESSNETIVSVLDKKNGYVAVTANKEGEATVTVTTEDGGFKAACKVTVMEEDIKVSGVELDKTELTLIVGSGKTLTATILPSSAKNKGVSWKSSDENVASVDENGRITAKKEGTATITVTTMDGAKTASCLVTVEKIPDVVVHVTDLKISTESNVINAGTTTKVTAKVIPENATNQEIDYVSSDETIARVTADGVVTGIKAGKVIIKAIASDQGESGTGIIASVEITVKAKQKPVTGVNISNKIMQMEKNETIPLTATVQPEDADIKDVTWESTDKSVATVSKDGSVTAINGGTALIIVTTADGKFTEICKVTVVVPVKDIIMNPDNTELVVGRNQKLTADIEPSDATNKIVLWNSNNPSVAFVDKYGQVTALKAGTAEITVVTLDGEKMASCKIKVVNAELPEDTDFKIAWENVKFDKDSDWSQVNESNGLDAHEYNDSNLTTSKVPEKDFKITANIAIPGVKDVKPDFDGAIKVQAAIRLGEEQNWVSSTDIKELAANSFKWDEEAGCYVAPIEITFGDNVKAFYGNFAGEYSFEEVVKDKINSVTLTCAGYRCDYEGDIFVSDLKLDNIKEKNTTDLNNQNNSEQQSNTGSLNNSNSQNASDLPAQEETEKGTLSLEESEQILNNTNTDKADPADSSFANLKLKAEGKKKSVKLSWSKVNGAQGYLIYGSACGQKMKFITTVDGGKKSYTVKNLKAGKYYKYVVKAYKEVAGQKRVIVTSKSVHAVTDGGKKGNPVKITVKKNTIKLKKGKSTTLKPQLISKKSVQTHIAKFRYESDDVNIAKVNKKGIVKAVKKGTCNIYIYAQNGIYKKVKIKVN